MIIKLFFIAYQFKQIIDSSNTQKWDLNIHPVPLSP